MTTLTQGDHRGILINGEPVELTESQRQRLLETGQYTIEFRGGGSVAVMLTEADQTYPAGRFRVVVEDDTFKLQRVKQQADAAGAEWTEAIDLITGDADGVSELHFSDLGLTNLFDVLILEVAQGSPGGLRFLELLDLADEARGG